jgi:RNA polymerase primary sigma factor
MRIPKAACFGRALGMHNDQHSILLDRCEEVPSGNNTSETESTAPARVGVITSWESPLLDPDTGFPRSRREPYCNNSLTLYLREIGKVQLLTPAEEIELAALIKKGDQAARDKMIKANLRLVVKIARQYENIGLPLMDLISEGNIGLMKAVERFDPSKGAKLSTYASWWIKQSMKRALANQSKTIRLPVHMVGEISKMHQAARRLQEALGREPTDDELGDELGVKASRVSQMRLAAIRPASLDAPLGDDDSNTFADVVQDEKAELPCQTVETQALTAILRDMIRRLSRREGQILCARFGLDGGRQKTLDEIGVEFSVTRERVRQVQNKALLKLRKMFERVDTGLAPSLDDC